MPVLHTPRLTCSPLQEEDWPFFLSLQQHPDVMRYVAEARPEEAIREAFDARLPAWTPGSDRWLCLVVRDNTSQMPLGVTGYIHHDE
ncbi:MAG: GNAT family N-acetyltransferase, partial [Leclercia adecarboxylata]|nr:GNAT family N-acetyltransferase [Leclercia adecarboxylata]